MRILLIMILCFHLQSIYAETDTVGRGTRGVIESIDLELRAMTINGQHFTLGDKLIVRDRQGNAIDQGILRPNYFISFSESENKSINSITIQSHLDSHITKH
ncbi:MAG: hypothetical protein U1E78_12575 [Gammaproteobacteria bacterium]